MIVNTCDNQDLLYSIELLKLLWYLQDNYICTKRRDVYLTIDIN